MNKKIKIIFLIFSLGLILNQPVLAWQEKENFPKIANYYLQPLIPEDHYSALAKYDLLILDIDVQNVNSGLADYLRQQNPDIKILAYLPAQSVNQQDLSSWAVWRNLNYNKVNQNNWWLRDSQGEIISFSDVWPTIKFVDPGQGWNDYLTDLIATKINPNNFWDGLFYDMVFVNLSWLNGGDISLNQLGQPDKIETINAYWQKQMTDLLQKTRNSLGDKVLVANVDIVDYYQDLLNGVMLENFPADWLGSNSWSILIDKYLNSLPQNNLEPRVYVLNVNTNNSGSEADFQKMRFGLASTLLGDGYFSFDFGDQAHNQIWWYDEYEVDLGQPQAGPKNLLNPSNHQIEAGLWLRHFDKGVSLVNSTKQTQNYVFENQQFEKIRGTQDKLINDGTKVNWVSLAPEDGLILLKFNQEIKASSFRNGSFVRVFNQQGHQVQNGFFAYQDGYPGNSEILINHNLVLYSTKGQVHLLKKDQSQNQSLTPYFNFKNEISLAVGDVTGDGVAEIITGAGFGGGPHVKVMTATGQLLNEFMAYDSAAKNGLKVSASDLTKDGQLEILVSLNNY